MTRLSVAIVTWNGRGRLPSLLASLAPANTDDAPAPEVVIVDNGSSDGTAEWLAAEHPAARVVANVENHGFARACNQAFTASSGDLVLFLNDDALPAPGALGALADHLDRHPEVVAAGPRLVDADGRPQEEGAAPPRLRAILHRIRLLRWTGLFRAAYRAYRRAGPPPEDAGPVPRLSGAALLVRRSALERLAGPWDERYPFGLEDVDLSLRLSRWGPLHHVPSARVVHLGGEASAQNVAFVYRGFEVGFARFLDAHDGRPLARWGYRLLVSLDQPPRALGLLVRWSLASVRGQPERAARARARLGAVLRFLLGGLPTLWRRSSGT